MSANNNARPAGYRSGRRNTDSTPPVYHDRPINRLLHRLEAARQTSAGQWMARCPAHDDRRPSLSVRELPDGKLLLHCWAGCGTADVLEAVGLALVDLYPAPLPIGDDRRPQRHRSPRWPAPDVLRCLASDASRLAIMAHDWASGRDIDYARLVETAGRIAAAADLA